MSLLLAAALMLLLKLVCSSQVLSVSWDTGTCAADAWGILEGCTWPAHGMAAIQNLHVPFGWTGSEDAVRHFAARFCKLRRVSGQFNAQVLSYPWQAGDPQDTCHIEQIIVFYCAGPVGKS